jgi:hypothetical protein
VQPGSSRLYVEGCAGVQVGATLIRAGRRAASGGGSCGNAGAAALDLVAPDGQPAAVAQGDRIEATVGDTAVDVTVPRFEASLGADATVVEGVADVGLPVVLVADLWWGAETGAERFPSATAQAAEDTGRFRIPLPSGPSAGSLRPAAGEEILVFVTTAEGHRVGRRFVGPRLDVDLDRGVVIGEAEPGLPVSWLAPPAAGGRVVASVGVTGSMRTELPGAAVVGARWQLWVGDQPVTVAVPELTVDFDGRTGTAGGTAPPEGMAGLAVSIGRHSPTEEFPVIVAEDGRWSVRLKRERGDPPAPDIDAADVRTVSLAWQGSPGLRFLRGRQAGR